MLDLVVIGAGPVGLAVAIEAKRAGLSVRVLDKGALCNSLVGYPARLEFFSTPELMEIGGHAFATIGDKPTREEALAYYRRVAQLEGLELILYDPVTGIEGRDGEFRVIARKTEHRSRRVAVAIGFFDVPNRLGVPGEDLAKVTHYFREPFPYADQDVLVVGAKNSAAKAALTLHRAGARVTLAVRKPALSESIKYWIRPDLENRIAEGSIKAHFDTTVQEIRTNSVELLTPSGRLKIENDFVVAMTGYRPDYAFLEDIAKLTFEDDPARTPKYDARTFETERQGLYLAGTVCGGLATSRWFIENGRFHAKRIAQHIAHGTAPSKRLPETGWQTAE